MELVANTLTPPLQVKLELSKVITRFQGRSDFQPAGRGYLAPLDVGIFNPPYKLFLFIFSISHCGFHSFNCFKCSFENSLLASPFP